MSTIIQERLFPFTGEDADYISWLESMLLAAQNPNEETTPRNARSILPDSPLGDYDRHSRDLTIVYCNTKHNSRVHKERKPTTSDLMRSQKNKGPQRQITPQWRREIISLLADIPTSTTWDLVRMERGLIGAESNRTAIRLMLGDSPLKTIGPEHPDNLPPPPLLFDNNDGHAALITKACVYGTAVFQSEVTNRMAVLVGKYQKLIFISYCIVLVSLGTKKDTVNWLMRRYISDSDDKNLARYRAGCLWVNRCASILLSQGWGHRSWEMFLLCDRSPHQYGRFSDARDSVSEFTTALGFANNPIYDNGRIPYCIPCLVKCLAGNDIDLQQICLCLGHEYSLTARIFDIIFYPLMMHRAGT